MNRLDSNRKLYHYIAIWILQRLNGMKTFSNVCFRNFSITIDQFDGNTALFAKFFNSWLTMYLTNTAMFSLYTSIARFLRPIRNARVTLHVVWVSRLAEVCQFVWLTGAVLQVSYWMDGLVYHVIFWGWDSSLRDSSHPQNISWYTRPSIQ